MEVLSATNYLDILGAKTHEYDWAEISISLKFDLSFIRLFRTNLVPWYLSRNKYLTEEVIKELQHVLYWEDVCRNLDLSETFIEEMAFNIDWNQMFNRRGRMPFTKKFFKKWYKKTNKDTLLDNYKLTKKELKICLPHLKKGIEW